MLTKQEVEIAIHDKHHRNHQNMLQISKEVPQHMTFDAIMSIIQRHLTEGVQAADGHRGIQSAEHLLSICNWFIVLEDDELANPEQHRIDVGNYGMGYFKAVAEKYHFKVLGLKTSENPGGLRCDDAQC